MAIGYIVDAIPPNLVVEVLSIFMLKLQFRICLRPISSIRKLMKITMILMMMQMTTNIMIKEDLATIVLNRLLGIVNFKL